MGRRAEAEAGLEELLRVAPDYDFARGLLLHARLTQLDWRDYDKSVDAILDALARGKRHSTGEPRSAISSGWEFLC